MDVVCPTEFSYVTVLGRPVSRGEVVTVDDELGDQLVAQGWTLRPAATKPSTTKVPPIESVPTPAEQE